MQNFKKSIPAGVVTLCVVSLLGLKDTGVFINEHATTTYSGNKISFAIGEKAEIVEEKDGGYIVAKGKARLNVPKEKILLTETDRVIYKVKKNTTIKSKEGKVLRNLFLGEEARLISEDGKNLVVVCADGTEGVVPAVNMELDCNSQRAITPAKVKSTTVATGDNGEVNLKKGDTINLVSYKDGNFVYIDENNAEYIVDASKVDLKNGYKIQVAEIATPRVETENTSRNENAGEARELTEDKGQKGIKVDLNNVKTNNPKVKDILNSAFDKKGSKYVYGAAGENSTYDCSGFVYAIYKNEFGINVPRSSKDQGGYGNPVEKSSLQAGDLVFFNTTGRGISHVGIYIGDGNFIHASSGQKKVVISNLDERYYSERYVTANRVL